MSGSIFSPSASLSFPPKSHPPKPQIPQTLISLAAAASISLQSLPLSLASSNPPFFIYYGTASSPSNYADYGANSAKKTSAEYIYQVPLPWKQHLISKLQKGTNGTDSEFYNPTKRTEREYLTFLPDIRALGPLDSVLGDLALSDVALQDEIAVADSVRAEERVAENGQVYYVYEIDGGGKHSLIAVTCKSNKLYAHFVSAPAAEWIRDEIMLRQLHDSFRTVDPQASSSSKSFSS